MKIQDGNGSSVDNGEATGKRAPQGKTLRTVNDDQDPKADVRNVGIADDIVDTEKVEEDTNSGDLKKIMNEFLAKLTKGLRV